MKGGALIVDFRYRHHHMWKNGPVKSSVVGFRWSYLPSGEVFCIRRLRYQMDVGRFRNRLSPALVGVM